MRAAYYPIIEFPWYVPLAVLLGGAAFVSVIVFVAIRAARRR